MVDSRSNLVSFFSSDLVLAVVSVALGLGLAGCFSSGGVVSQGLGAASQAAGEQVGQALGAEIARSADLPPPGSARYDRFMVSQAQVMFSYAFSAGGMWPAQARLQPGEWVMYEIRGSGGETALDTLERAFLKTTEDGQQWWRVRGVQQGEAWIYEALIDTTRQEVVRMRTKDPDGAVGEVPVTEKTVYRPPQTLTEESIQGATTGTEQVDTPAGTFTARRVEYEGSAGSGTTTWFLAEEVPGQVVRYQAARGGNRYTSRLIDYGSNATTSLDAY